MKRNTIALVASGMIISLVMAGTASAQVPVPSLSSKDLATLGFCTSLKRDSKAQGEWAASIPKDEALATEYNSFTNSIAARSTDDAQNQVAITMMLLRARVSNAFLGVSAESVNPPEFYAGWERYETQDMLTEILMHHQESETLRNMQIINWNPAEKVRVIKIMKDISASESTPPAISNLAFNYAIAVSKGIYLDCNRELTKYFDKRLNEIKNLATKNFQARTATVPRSELDLKTNLEIDAQSRQAEADTQSTALELTKLNEQRAQVGFPPVNVVFSSNGVKEDQKGKGSDGKVTEKASEKWY